jgi:hypothetical protein
LRTEMSRGQMAIVRGGKKEGAKAIVKAKRQTQILRLRGVGAQYRSKGRESESDA